MLAAVDKSRRLAEYDDVEASVERSQTKLRELERTIKSRGDFLDSLLLATL